MTHHTLALFQNIGPWEVIIIAVVALLLFGRRLPEVGRSLGKGIVEFKKGLRDVQDSVERDAEPKPSNTYASYRPPLGTEPTAQHTSESQASHTQQSQP
jgi:sec-independent protein translocase protein TatA